jgi:hypothetical protein
MCNLANSQGWRTMFYSPENKPYQRHAKNLIDLRKPSAAQQEVKALSF